MQHFLGYQTQTKLYESDNTLVFRANGDNNNSVVLKILKSENPATEEIQRFHNEYNLTLSLNSLARVINTYGLERDGERLIMLMEDFGATSLDRLLIQTCFSLEQVLDIAIAVMEGLDEIHCASIIHKNINPSNIVMNPDTGQVKLIDFGIAKPFNNKETLFQNLNIVEGTLSYISPEQTGRIGQTIDHRTDFYSFGATLYELLAHKPPFNTTDPMDLIHCHLAKDPMPLSDIHPDIPEAISEIVMKLMSKDTEKRYTAAKGVRADLQRCLDLVKKGEQNFTFVIGNEDKCQTLKIPQKLFGRKKEMETLQSNFQQVLAGKKNIVCVKGPAGIGKTMLIQKIEQYVLKNNSIFISGKFDLLQQSIPYTGIIQAFRQLARYLLTRSDHDLNKWQKKLKKALGNQGYEILELVPEFEKILGPKSPISGLGGHEARNRFYLMVENFLSVFAKKNQPFVLFMDDLQWVDPSSLELIKQIISSPVIESMLILGAFRDNEVNAEHPLKAMIEMLKKEEVFYQSILLAPLEVSTISQMIVECLDCSEDKALPLVQWVHTRSLGNPFHGKELLTFLNEQKKMVYDIPQHMWSWDLMEIQALYLPDSITDLLAKKIQTLAKPTQNILMRAACIGTTFEPNTLSIVCERSHDEICKALEESIEAGLILQLQDKRRSASEKENLNNDVIYRFIHDRIHSAAYNLMPEDKRLEFHRQTGQLLLRNLPVGQKEARIFEIVNHLNKGRTLLLYGPEQKELARHNLEAAQKAKASSAFDQAYTYFKIGINLLESTNDPIQAREKPDTHHWQESYELISTLYLGAIETAYLSTRFDEVEQLGQILLDHSTNVLDQLRVYRIKVQAFNAQNRMTEATSTALQGLRVAGIRFSTNPKNWEVVMEYIKTWFLLSGKSGHRLDAMQTTTNLEKIVAQGIIQDATISIGFSDLRLFHKNLLPMMFFKGIRLCVLYGTTADRAIGLAGYAMILSGKLGKLEAGYRFACQAIDLMESIETSRFNARILIGPSCHSIHWKKHLKDTLPYLLDAHEKGLKNGDFEFSAIAAHIISIHSFWMGEDLSSVQKTGEAYQKVIRRVKQKTFQQYQNILLQTISNLKGRSKHPHELIGEHHDETIMLSQHKASNDAGALYTFYILKAMLCFLFDRQEEAMGFLFEAKKYILNQIGTTMFVQYYLYDSLVCLKTITRIKSDEQQTHLKRVKKNQKKMKKWAKSAPMNYEHKYLLVKAEYSRVKNKPEKAARLYDRAIKKAREQGYIQEAAIASELAARFYLNINKSDKARDHLKQAWHDYFKWGATAKLSQLEVCYPDVFPNQNKSVKTEFDSPTRTILSTPGELLDWNAVLKASVSISSEIQFEQLLEKLMQIVIKTTGAQRSVLFLKDNNELIAAAVYPVESAQKKLSNPISLENYSQVPKSVIHYVERMKESIIFDNEDTDPSFKNDPYIVAQRPKSLLCFPLQYKSNLMGIFYLENNMVAGAFTSHSLESLKILSAQISVSLENARLYRDLNDQTQKLTSVNKKLQQEIEHRYRIETELKGYHDKLKKDLDTQAKELLESRQTLANIKIESSRKHRFRNIIGKSDQMRKIYELIEDLSNVNANVLITGESGTGKELVANALHYSEQRKDLPFVKVNCSALSESLLESELFGHVKGAFTGAENNKIGRFQKAGKGTILLDEIGDVTLHFQKRLLRVLQEREFEQLGDTKTIQMNARIIASTNKDLMKKIKDKSFREDLYYRLKVMEIKVPSLRERKEDIPLLTSHFLSEFNNEMSKNITTVSEETYMTFMSYNWPGNIRELRNIMEHAAVTCKGSTIRPENLPLDFNLMPKEISGPISSDSDNKEKILQALNKANWNKTEAAKLLGISRRTLYRKLEQHSIE
ncbi:MAG: sigma 54-interacting transcriptional regulator [Desulfobacula sp.]|nr:sigma 54-interacting transcriptional regulator [Desulfobacula sp.]